MSLHGNDICLLEVEDYNLYEEEASDHAFIGGEKHSRSGGKTMEAEKRIRREIANSNERRRMQSINAGFQALRTLLPRHEGEKLSKAAILQQTAEYIYSLEQEKTRLLSQNCQLKRLLNQHEGGDVPLKKRKGELMQHIAAATAAPPPPPPAAPAPAPAAPAPDSTGEVEASVADELERERRARRVLEARLRALQPPPAAAAEPAVKAAPSPPPACAPACPAAAAAPPAAAPEPSPLLEAAIKAEPRVEVEVLPEAPARLYLAAASRSRQNLETIVEAIRHLEGDHLFRDREEPLALLARAPPAAAAATPLPAAPLPAPAPPPPRPGVIVVKHS